MAQRNLVTVLGGLGALLIILGGIVGFLLSWGPGGFGPRFGVAGAAVYGFVAILLGLIILVFSGYTHFRGVATSLEGGITLLVIGVVTWVLVGSWVLVALGSFLTVLAGLLLTVQVLLAQRPRVLGAPS